MLSILAGRDITDILEAVLSEVTTGADGDSEVEVDSVAYLDTGAAVTTEENFITDADVDMEDEDTEAVADRDLVVVTGTAVLAAWYRAAHCQLPALFKGRLSVPLSMNFWKSSKPPLTPPPPFWEKCCDFFYKIFWNGNDPPKLASLMLKIWQQNFLDRK